MWSMMPTDADAPVPDRAANQWIPGTQEPSDPLDAVAVFDLDGKSVLRKLAHWNGSQWQFPGGVAIEAKCIKWYPLPDDKEE